jgi:hypothetical protein
MKLYAEVQYAMTSARLSLLALWGGGVLTSVASQPMIRRHISSIFRAEEYARYETSVKKGGKGGCTLLIFIP